MNVEVNDCGNCMWDADDYNVGESCSNDDNEQRCGVNDSHFGTEMMMTATTQWPFYGFDFDTKSNLLYHY